MVAHSSTQKESLQSYGIGLVVIQTLKAPTVIWWPSWHSSMQDKATTQTTMLVSWQRRCGSPTRMAASAPLKNCAMRLTGDWRTQPKRTQMSHAYLTGDERKRAGALRSFIWRKLNGRPAATHIWRGTGTYSDRDGA